MTDAPQPPASPAPLLLDRRGFLRSSAGGLAAVAVASMVPAGCGRSYPQANGDGVSLLALSPKEYAVIRAAAEALLVGVPMSAGAVARAIDAELAAVGDPVRADVKSVLSLIEHTTLLGGQVRRFTVLPAERRLAVLNGWGRSRFVLRRGAYLAVRGFVYYFAFIREESREITRFAGAWPERLAIPASPVDFGEVA